MIEKLAGQGIKKVFFTSFLELKSCLTRRTRAKKGVLPRQTTILTRNGRKTRFALLNFFCTCQPFFKDVNGRRPERYSKLHPFYHRFSLWQKKINVSFESLTFLCPPNFFCQHWEIWPVKDWRHGFFKDPWFFVPRSEKKPKKPAIFVQLQLCLGPEKMVLTFR